MTDQYLSLLADALHTVVHGEAWHGPSLLEAMELVPPHRFREQLGESHSAADIVLHSVAWIEEVTRRLHGASPQMPARGDWTDAAPLTVDALRALVVQAAAECEDAIRHFPADRVHHIVGSGDRDAPLGAGVSYGAMMHGVSLHTAYHAGQVMLRARQV